MTIYWINDVVFPGALGIMARPRAGDWLEDEIEGWKRGGVARVVSLIEQSEVLELGLEREASICEANGIAFCSLPIVDRGLPSSMLEVESLCGVINETRKLGQWVAVHCRAGIGRSSLIAASSLVVAGVRPDEAFGLITKARGLTVPDTPEQVAWVGLFAEWRRR